MKTLCILAVRNLAVGLLVFWTSVTAFAEWPEQVALSALDGGGGFAAYGKPFGEAAGGAVAAAGDVNADGFADYMISAPLGDTEDTQNVGVVYVLFGGETGFHPASIDLADVDGTGGFLITGIDPSDVVGSAIDAAGDVNGDGIDDLLLGMPGADFMEHDNAGEAYIIYGSDKGFPSVIDLSTLAPTVGSAISGYVWAGWVGSAVSRAGDVNDDGLDDVIIGAWNVDRGTDIDVGEAYVVFGDSPLLPATVDLAALDGTNGFVVKGISASDHAGWSVSGGGDVNSDGISDIAVGAYGGEVGTIVNAGHTYVIFGSSSGFAAAFDPATLDGTNGFRLEGSAAGDQSGYSVAIDGDVNGDGIADVIVGAYRGDPPGRANAGITYVVFGRSGGFPAVIDLGALDGSDGFAVYGIATNDRSGFSVANAGDVDGDGDDELLIGALQAAPGGRDLAGQAYLIFGRSTAFPATIDAALLDGVTGFVFDGIDEEDFAGECVAGIGDINGDGFAEIAIGAYGGDPAPDRPDAGEAYVVFGIPRECTAGRVNDTQGPASNVLYVNGSFGESDRVVRLTPEDLLVLTMLRPPAGGNGKFVIHANEERPTSSSVTPLPAQIGSACFPFLLTSGAAPVIVANNIGKTAFVGESVFYGVSQADPSPAATSFFYAPLSAGTVLTFQAVIVDPVSNSPKGASTTNAIILEVF